MPSTEGKRPSGAQLDHLVLWAIHNVEGPIYTAAIQFYVCLKAGTVGIDDTDPAFYRSVMRSLGRLQNSGVIQVGRADGYEFTEIPQ